MHEGFTRRGPGWRSWIVVLAIALIGAASVSTVGHEWHDADQDCAVCQLRHYAVADLIGARQVRPADVLERFIQPSAARWIAADRSSQVPARAPPA